MLPVHLPVFSGLLEVTIYGRQSNLRGANPLLRLRLRAIIFDQCPELSDRSHPYLIPECPQTWALRALVSQYRAYMTSRSYHFPEEDVLDERDLSTTAKCGREAALATELASKTSSAQHNIQHSNRRLLYSSPFSINLFSCSSMLLV